MMTLLFISNICLTLAMFLAEVYSECSSAGVCLPGPVNAARLVDKTVTATSTCGDPPAKYCRAISDCSVCNKTTHSVDFMTDGNPNTNWQSVTWWQWFKENNDTDVPLQANVTISFNKSYAITGEICITFRYPRPKKMILEKSADKGKTWVTLQYYADSCEDRFNLESFLVEDIFHGDYRAHCVEEYSSLSPQRDGRVLFDFVRRYTDDDFWNGTLQEYFTATDLRMQLLYPGTDGQENVDNKIENIFNRFFYGISDLKVNARCQCNGHALYCDYPDYTGKDCDCLHNTEGQDCERCKPLFNNKAWMPATSDSEPNPCEACECHQHADSCHYNGTLDHGVCDDCYHNTTGVFCEHCVDKFYRNMSKPLNDPEVCLSCNCFRFGITNNGTCNQTTGQCECKQNVTGRQCDGCEDTFWGFQLPPVGHCLACSCNNNGTRNGSLSCNQQSGQCPCKTNIHLRTCSECRDGFYAFPDSASLDCLKCDCDYGGSVEEICEKTNGTCLCRSHIQGKHCTEIQEDHFVGFFTHLMYEAEHANGDYMLVSPFTGVDQEFTGLGYGKISHNQFITFVVNFTTEFGEFFPVIRFTASHIVNATLRLTIITCNNSNCSTVRTLVISQLHAGIGLAWISTSSVSFTYGQVYHLNLTYESGMFPNSSIEVDSLILLPNLSNTRIYKVVQAANEVHGLTLAQIEECWANSTTITGSSNNPDICRNATFSVMVEVFDGALACSCNSTGTEEGINCDQFGGQCHCKPGITGRSCDRCLPGYFNFTAEGCSACNCSALGSSSLVCDEDTGQCPCKPGVVTRTCSRCNTTFYGFHTGHGCVECDCNVNGSADLQCDRNGTCPCKNSTSGTKCDMCQENFFNFTSHGCQPCNCQEGGSKSLQCHLNTGICTCKANAEGMKCELCRSGTYNSDPQNPDGCSPCFCFGRSSTCSSAKNFVKAVIRTEFSAVKNVDSHGDLMYADFSPSYNISFVTNSSVNFTFEEKFQGDQLRSYGQFFMLTMNYANQASLDSVWSVKLTGANRKVAIFGILPAPSLSHTDYHAQLHERYSLTNLTAYELQSILVSLDSVVLQGSFKANGSVKITNGIRLVTAVQGIGEEVGHVENCSCSNNYTRLSCGFCSQGFTRQNMVFSSSVNVFSSCVLCSCNNRSKDCFPENGTCYNCRTGSEGTHCERCQPGVDNGTDCTRCTPGFYGLTPSSGGCQDCDCVLPNTLYGNSTVCDRTTGQCICKPEIAGRPCDRCHENAYNTSDGCVDCPECYRLILVEVKKLRESMGSLEETLKRLQDGRIGDVTFAQRINTSINSTKNLVFLADQSIITEARLRNEIQQLNQTLNQLEHVLETEVTLDVQELKDNLTAVEQNINATEQLIRLVREAILYSHRLLNSTVDPFVREAELISGDLSSLVPSFSMVAQNFTAVAAQQNGTGDGIKNKVENAESIVRGAQSEANSSITDQNELESFLSDLRMRLDEIRTLGESVNFTAFQLFVNASMVFLTANDTLSEVSLLDPNNMVMVISIESAAKDAARQAEELISKANNLTQVFTNLTFQVEVTTERTRNLMSRVSNAEAMGQEILSEVHRAREEAIAAVQLATDTHTDALEMLQILQDFENRSIEAQGFAALALQHAKDANTTSWNAIQFAQGLNASIQATLSTAKQGLVLAQRVKNISLSEKQNVSVIHDKAVSLSQDAAISKYTSEYFEDVNLTVTVIQSDSQDIINACETNYSVQTSNALGTAQIAKSEADKADMAARNVHARVDRVVRDAARLREVNVTRLNELKVEMDAVRLNFTGMNIEGISRDLRKAKEAQEQFISEQKAKLRERGEQIAELKLLLSSLTSVSCDQPTGMLV